MTAPPVFLVGATRSGTSWLQAMLGAHPEIATAQELELFTGYLLPWHERWRLQRPDSEDQWARNRYKGLPAVLTAQDVLDLGRQTAAFVHGRLLALKPGASVVLEKDPAYTPYTGLVRMHFPDARFIHLIRDGRDVAASLMRGSQGWARGWAADTAERAAHVWRTNVTSGRAPAQSSDYVEVRYETLLGHTGPNVLAELFSFCGVAAEPALAADVYEAFSLGAAKRAAAHPRSLVWGGEVALHLDGTQPVEPEGFFGNGTHGGWREVFTAYDRWVFDQVAGDLLVELGYEPDRTWARTPTLSRRLYAVQRAMREAASRSRFAGGAAKRILREPRWREPDAVWRSETA